MKKKHFWNVCFSSSISRIMQKNWKQNLKNQSSQKKSKLHYITNMQAKNIHSTSGFYW